MDQRTLSGTPEGNKNKTSALNVASLGLQPDIKSVVIIQKRVNWWTGLMALTSDVMRTDTRVTIRYYHEKKIIDTHFLRNVRTYACVRTYARVRIGTIGSTLPVLMGAVRTVQRYSGYSTRATGTTTREMMATAVANAASNGPKRGKKSFVELFHISSRQARRGYWHP